MKDFGPLAFNVCMLGPSEQNVSVQALLPVKEEPQQAGSRVSLNYISPKPFSALLSKASGGRISGCTSCQDFDASLS